MIISHINTIRASLGRNLLIVDPVYSTLAQAKVNDMIARDYHAHRDPDGLYVRSLAEKIGLDIR